MTTKEQERKALEQIRKIVEGLGENSYVGTALDGCLQDAQDNIDDDAAYSMKSRWETAESQLKVAAASIKELKRQIAEYRKTVDRLNKTAFDEDMIEYFLYLIREAQYIMKDRINSQEQIILDNAENPTSEEFKGAVTARKAFQAKLAFMNENATKVASIRSAMNA